MFDCHSSAYAEAALADEVRIIGTTPKGRGLRNEALNRGAYKIGGLVGAGSLSETAARDALLSAARQNGYLADHGEGPTLDVIEHGLRAGIASPRDLSTKGDSRHPNSRPVTGKNGTNSLPLRTPPNKDGNPKFLQWGDDGPPKRDSEIRRHIYRRDGIAVRAKIKSKGPNGPTYCNFYRVRSGSELGWQAKQPDDYVHVPYVTSTINPFDPDLVANDVWWTEGEKDCEALGKLNIAAYCWGGCGDGLPPGIDAYLAGRRIVIPADNDEAGQQHAQEKAARAHAASAASIKIVEFPELPLKGDVSDFIAAGGTAEGLYQRVHTALFWQPSASDDTSAVDDDTGHSWDRPDLSLLDDRRGELPAFPLDVFSARWQLWSKNSAHGAGTAVDYVIVPLLGIASGLIGTARRLKASASWSEPFTLWTAQLGYSGAGKTPGMNVSQRTLASIERNRRRLIGELRRAHESKIERAKAARKQWLNNVEKAVEAGSAAPDMPPEAEIPERFEAPRLFVSNATIEKLAILLQARPQGMPVILDELAGLFLNLSRYSGGTDKEFWLEAWNGNTYRVERVNRPPVDVEYLLIGLVGGFQPDKVAKSFDGDADGIYARVLFSWPTEAPYRPLTDLVNEIDPELENILTKFIDLAEFVDDKLVVRTVALTDDARKDFERFRELVHHKKDGLDGREREWWVKTPAHVLRLAGTLAYLDWAMESVGKTTPAPTTIEARFVAAAVRLVTEYFWPHARAALRQIGLTDANAKARKVLRWLRAERKEQVSIEDVRRDALQQSLNAEATGKLVEEFVQAGLLRKAPIENRGPGRHAHRWDVNPILWTGTDNSTVTEDGACGEQSQPAEIAQIAEIPPAITPEPIPAISAICATRPESASNEGEVTWEF
jgi:hypothetical protein